jgi:hypothetical protein
MNIEVRVEWHQRAATKKAPPYYVYCTEGRKGEMCVSFTAYTPSPLFIRLSAGWVQKRKKKFGGGGLPKDEHVYVCKYQRNAYHRFNAKVVGEKSYLIRFGYLSAMCSVVKFPRIVFWRIFSKRGIYIILL